MFSEKFDPLSAKYSGNEEAVIRALKREITNILHSYVGWFDPFCELIQNGLDAIDERLALNEDGYTPTIKVLINIKDNLISVTDNGIGFEEEKYKKHLAPNFSFKNGETRGYKGVGATYLAYGFNYMQIATKSPEFSAIGVIRNARKWINDENPASNPMVVPDENGVYDHYFSELDRGVSICLKFDQYTTPGKLSWIQIKTAENWLNILRVRTGIGAIKENNRVRVLVEVIDNNGYTTICEMQGLKYLWANEFADKCMFYTDVRLKLAELHEKYGKNYRIPSKYSNLKLIHDMWDARRIATEIILDEGEQEILDKHNPILYFAYAYSLSVWDALNAKTGIRSGQYVLFGGIQMGANNMPQGEIIQIPLKRNTGRQFQAHFYVHFDDCCADLGRKGFQKDVTEFTKSIAKKILDGPLQKVRECFRNNTGEATDLIKVQDLENWKNEMITHESLNPLTLVNEHFFLPLNQISITSTPTREQDVIALFNQLLAGGVIRNIKVMATNERFTYDGLYKIVITPPFDHHIYDKENNPLGVFPENIKGVLEKYPDGFLSSPKVLEYKFTLDGLIEDIADGSKNTNDIGLVVAWNAGELYKQNYYISSLLIDDNICMRQYHGITHVMCDLISKEKVCDLILLEDLIQYLNDPIECITRQSVYDEQ